MLCCVWGGVCVCARLGPGQGFSRTVRETEAREHQTIGAVPYTSLPQRRVEHTHRATSQCLHESINSRGDGVTGNRDNRRAGPYHCLEQVGSTTQRLDGAFHGVNGADGSLQSMGC